MANAAARGGPGQLAAAAGATRAWVVAIERGKRSAELGLVLRATAEPHIWMGGGWVGVLDQPRATSLPASMHLRGGGRSA